MVTHSNSGAGTRVTKTNQPGFSSAGFPSACLSRRQQPGSQAAQLPQSAPASGIPKAGKINCQLLRGPECVLQNTAACSLHLPLIGFQSLSAGPSLTGSPQASPPPDAANLGEILTLQALPPSPTAPKPALLLGTQTDPQDMLRAECPQHSGHPSCLGELSGVFTTNQSCSPPPSSPNSYQLVFGNNVS